MPISASDRDKIMGYLAIPVNAETISQVLEALAAIAPYPETESRITAILTKLTSIESQLDTSRNTVGSPYSQLKEEAQRQCYLLSNTLGLEVKRKVF